MSDSLLTGKQQKHTRERSLTDSQAVADLSRYLRAVTGNTQLSAMELGRLPLGEHQQ